MIQKNRLQRVTFKIGNSLDLINGFCVVCFGAVTSAKASAYKEWPHPFPEWIARIQEYSFQIWFALGAIGILGWYLRRRGDPWVWDKLQSLLDAFQANAYCDFPNDIKDHHRVTLFRYKKWCWSLATPMTKGRWPWCQGRYPWSGWLVPVLRSGKTSQNTRAVFSAPDNGNRAEGVVGYAWASNQTTVVSNLPNLLGNSSERRINSYAQRTFCPVPIVKDYVARQHPLPRSIGAIPIEVNNEPWGVLVLDSRDEVGVTAEALESFTLAVKSISQMLEKAR